MTGKSRVHIVAQSSYKPMPTQKKNKMPGKEIKWKFKIDLTKEDGGVDTKEWTQIKPKGNIKLNYIDDYANYKQELVKDRNN